MFDGRAVPYCRAVFTFSLLTADACRVQQVPACSRAEEIKPLSYIPAAQRFVRGCYQQVKMSFWTGNFFFLRVLLYSVSGTLFSGRTFFAKGFLSNECILSSEWHSL